MARAEVGSPLGINRSSGIVVPKPQAVILQEPTRGSHKVLCWGRKRWQLAAIGER